MSLYVVSLLSTLGGVLFAYAAGKFPGTGWRTATVEFTAQAQSLIGAVPLSPFVLLTGFRVAGSRSALSSARSRTYDESRAPADAYRAAGGLAAPDRDTERALLRQYTGAVRTAEVARLAHGRTGPVAREGLDRTRAAIGAATAATPARAAARAAAQDSPAAVHRTRTDRAAQASGRMPHITSYAMLGGGAPLIALPALLGVGVTARHLAALCCVGAAAAFAIALAAQFGRPFQGPMRVRAAAFVLAEHRFDQMDTEGTPSRRFRRPDRGAPRRAAGVRRAAAGAGHRVRRPAGPSRLSAAVEPRPRERSGCRAAPHGDPTGRGSCDRQRDLTGQAPTRTGDAAHRPGGRSGPAGRCAGTGRGVRVFAYRRCRSACRTCRTRSAPDHRSR